MITIFEMNFFYLRTSRFAPLEIWYVYIFECGCMPLPFKNPRYATVRKHPNLYKTAEKEKFETEKVTKILLQLVVIGKQN